MKYTIEKEPFPVLNLTLDEGEIIDTANGAMSWMSDSLEMATSAGGSISKAFGRMFSGEGMFQNIYTAKKNDSKLSITASFPGEIIAVDVTNKPIIAQKTAFLARSHSTCASVYFQKRIGATFFGGEGLIMQKFEGEGLVFLEIDGAVVLKELAAGEKLILDTGYLAAMEDTIDFNIESVKGAKNMFLGGEGIFNTVVTGPGKVWIQTMPRFKSMNIK